MRLLEALLQRRRLVLACVALLAAAGLSAWNTMPREEDPPFPERDGLVVIRFPGADATAVERLVVEPVEERLAEVEEIDSVYSTARAGVAVLHVELRQVVYATEEAWDDVEDALVRARRDFPQGVLEPELDHDLVSLEAVVLAVRGSTDTLKLVDAAEKVKRRLLSMPAVREVTLIGDPGEQITIEYDDAMARRLGLEPDRLVAQLGGRSAILPGGLIHLGDKAANLRPQTEFRSLEEIRRTPILLASGASVQLGELARVRHGPVEPARERMRLAGEPAVGVGIVPVDGLDRVRFGRELRQEIALAAEDIAPLELSEVFFQPDQVELRLQELSGSLRLGIVVVAGVLFLSMGLRLGTLVALVLPLVTFGSVALYAATGGILNQISIAALVIALGMLVDNAIVMAENIQYRVDLGEPVASAAAASVRELAFPLGTATGTTLAAFVPMLLSKGNTADFTRSIPSLIMLTLLVSYLFAVVATPVLAGLLLAPRSRNREVRRWTRRVARLGVRHSGLMLGMAAVLLTLSVLAARWVDRQFFPAADRSILMVNLRLPEGSHLEATDRAARTLEQAMEQRPEVLSVATFMGRSSPKFYYNLPTLTSSPHLAQLVVETDSLSSVEEMIPWTRRWARENLPGAEVVPTRLEQGPPIDAPIMVRLYGQDLRELEAATKEVVATIRSESMTRDVRHDLGLGVPTVAFEIDDAAAGRHGLARADVARVLLGRTLGTTVGQFRFGEDPIPILLRSSAGEQLPATQLPALDIGSPQGEMVPLAQVARLEVAWQPAAIRHHRRERVVTVFSQLAEGATASGVLQTLGPQLEALDFGSAVHLEMAGEAAESGEANSAIARVVPLGLLLLLFFLLLEFNSFRRVGIVLVTVPLSAVGVVPGLLLSGQPFGFTSLLGVISLVGIVVNNAIVLLDVIESRRQDGDSVAEALVAAVERRTRPILLTMATTIAGLLPLAFSDTTLWPPLAWAMISGLLASTVLTLLVVPALYRLLFDPPWRRGPDARPALATVALLLCLLPFLRPASTLASETAWDSDQAHSVVQGEGASGLPSGLLEEPQSLTLDEVLERAVRSPAVTAAQAVARGADAVVTENTRQGRWPSLSVSGNVSWTDELIEIATPLGDFELGSRRSEAVSLNLVQPLLQRAQQSYTTPAARSEAAARGLQAQRARQLAEAAAAEAFLRVLAIDARLASIEAFVDSLRGRLEDAEARVVAGRSLELDSLKVRLDLESALLDQFRLQAQRKVAMLDLGRTVGQDRPVEPRYDGRFERQADLRPEKLAELALGSRLDLAALEQGLQALRLQVASIRAERWPSVDAVASWGVTNGDAFRPESQLQGGLRLVWRPFQAGTRKPRAAVLEAEVDRLAADRQEIRRLVTVQIGDALAELSAARQAVVVRERGVGLAEEARRVEGERHAAGRSTTNDLLEAEAELRQQRTEQALARLEVLGAWIRLRLAVGDDQLWQAPATSP